MPFISIIKLTFMVSYTQILTNPVTEFPVMELPVKKSRASNQSDPTE